MQADKLFEKIENNNPVDFGDIFTKSIDLFKKVWSQGFIHLLISMLIVLPLVLIMYIPIFALAGLAGFEPGYSGYDYGHEELSVGLGILFVILVIVMSMLASAFQLGIMAHFYKVCKQADMGSSISSSYFMFFKGKYLERSLL